MYESPINQVLGEMYAEYEDGCMKILQKNGFYVDKDELVKALQYDRDQYEKGYNDGYEKAISDFYDKALNFEDYINPLECDEELFYHGKEIAKMVMEITGELRGKR